MCPRVPSTQSIITSPCLLPCCTALPRPIPAMLLLLLLPMLLMLLPMLLCFLPVLLPMLLVLLPVLGMLLPVLVGLLHCYRLPRVAWLLHVALLLHRLQPGGLLLHGLRAAQQVSIAHRVLWHCRCVNCHLGWVCMLAGAESCAKAITKPCLNA